MTGQERRVTIDDVARLAGVSKATVSRHLNGKSWVSPDATRAVGEAIEALGYVPNGSAQKLAKQRTDYVGCVFSEPMLSLSENPVFAVLLQDITRELSVSGRSTVLLFAQTPEEEERVLHYARARHVDGIIIMTPVAGSRLLTELVRTGFPTVTTGPVSDDPDWPVPYAGVDDAMGSTQAVEHLLETGRRAIGVVSGPLRTPGAHTRLQAAVDALDGAPAERVEEAAAFTVAAGYEAARVLLERCPDLDALYVASDVLAIGAADYLQRSGRRIPEDVALVGFDNVATNPPLTTVAPVGSGTSPAALITDLLDGKTVRSVLNPTMLVRRTST
ncbi:transcriptional regulator [Sanguibacter keddieii DSM 10542]|uniref:Transcriptional regulator n=1 Tax=Sanguibacter keddieii (strain ATCC 51767 / DSM 10542 / NCFB 3025 / ST-74) TaxID=446469 RepID=D1BF66_SANKS|nr:transcriptional regulator [Sanguibacter keddieii DSM 10542]